MNIRKELNRYFLAASIEELRASNIDTHNVSYNSMLYVNIIESKDKCTISYIAKNLNISKSAVTIKVNELEMLGLVKRVKSETDKRVNYLKVTDKVIEICKSYYKNTDKCIKEVNNNYTKTEIDSFCRILKEISESLVEGLDNG